MEFRPQATLPPPKNLYPCLATITINPTAPTDKLTRRLSSGSQGDEDGNALRRVISGGRRKGSFGSSGAQRPSTPDDVKRMMLQEPPQPVPHVDEISGKWYWRVQAGADKASPTLSPSASQIRNHLILLPLSHPANPLLTSPPQPLSQAMPAHSSTAAQAKTSMPGGANEKPEVTHKKSDESSLAAKFKHLFHIGSPKSSAQSLPEEQSSSVPAQGAAEGSQSASGETGNSSLTTATGAAGVHERAGSEQGDAISNVHSTTSTAVEDRILDQNARGQMMPSAEGNRVGATNLNANAETEWPGVIKGEKLGAIQIDLRTVDKSKVVLGGGKSHEGSWVIVPINSQFFSLVHPMLDSMGRSHHDFPRSGTIRFDFDKDWIGAKGEAELLHYYITTAIENLPPINPDRQPPHAEELRLRQPGAVPTVATVAADQSALSTAPSGVESTIASQPEMTSTSIGSGQPAADVGLAKEVGTK